MYRVLRLFCTGMIAISTLFCNTETIAKSEVPQDIAVQKPVAICVEPTYEEVKLAPKEKVVTTSTYDRPYLEEWEIELIALVTMAEAEGECEEGKRLVIDTILNRMDSKHFPDTVYDVIYQKNQFSSMWNGRIDRVETTPEVYRLVLEELESRTNTDVIFFQTRCYSEYGTPLFQVENHYFSSY